MLVLSSSRILALKRSSSICCLFFNTHTPLCKPLELVHKLPFIVGRNVPLPKCTLKIISILYWRIPMNPSFPNKGSPPIEGIPLKAKGIQWNFYLFTNMMASKELFNLHFPIQLGLNIMFFMEIWKANVNLLRPSIPFSSLGLMFSNVNYGALYNSR